MDTVEHLVDLFDKLQALPAAALVFLSCIVCGYCNRMIRLKWFSSDATPIFVILWGAFLFSFIAVGKTNDMPIRVWILRNVAIGGIIGLAAWLSHAIVLKRVEDWIASKSTIVDRLLNWEKPPTPPPSAPPSAPST